MSKPQGFDVLDYAPMGTRSNKKVASGWLCSHVFAEPSQVAAWVRGVNMVALHKVGYSVQFEPLKEGRREPGSMSGRALLSFQGVPVILDSVKSERGVSASS